MEAGFKSGGSACEAQGNPLTGVFQPGILHSIFAGFGALVPSGVFFQYTLNLALHSTIPRIRLLLN